MRQSDLFRDDFDGADLLSENFAVATDTFLTHMPEIY